MDFSYSRAFQSNIGVITQEEQERLRNCVIAIPGMGGVGSSNLISFVRSGFERFKIADYDIFQLKNFNRQYGATIETVNREKSEVMKEIALKLNPYCNIEVYSSGIDSHNLDRFLDGVDLGVDSLDAFEVDMRREFINRSLNKRIPVVSAGPIGFGTSYLIFLPGGLNFDEYFGVNGQNSYNEKLAAFLVGLVPHSISKSYLKPELGCKKGPSIIGGVDSAVSANLANAVKILINKGEIKEVPYCHQFDPFVNKYLCRRYNHRNFIQKFKRRALVDIFDGRDSWLARLCERLFIKEN